MIILAACDVPAKLAPDAPVPDASIDAPVETPNLDTILDASPPDITNEANATFRFHSNVASATFQCHFDQEQAQPCTSPVMRTLGDGSHTFSVRAIDSSGNSDDTPAERVWTIDTVAPETMLTRTPPAADNSVNAQFEFQSNEMNAMFECALDGGGFVACKSGDSFGPLSDGAHSFSVRAKDAAGNVDASPPVYAWRVDTSTPDTVIASGPQGAVGVTTATFTFYSPDAGGGATFQCSLDGAAFTTCTSPQSYANLSERVHTFAVRVRDAVGNFDPTPATRGWTVDLTPPTTTITAGPTGTVAMASASFSFTSNESTVTFACNLDGAGFMPCTSPASYAGLAQGDHAFAVRATDAAGHDDPSPATRTWSVDTIAPDLQITAGPASGSTTGPRVTFTFTISDGNATCAFDAAPLAPCTSPLAKNLPDGAHEFTVRAMDAAGNANTVTRAWTVACAPPDPTGAAGLLHVDDAGQTQSNAVAGGVDAVLGDTNMVEPADPEPFTPGRFGGALAFTSADGDHVSWAVALPDMPDLTVELWARPNAAAGQHDVFASGDSRLVVSVAAKSPSTVAFSTHLVGQGPGAKTVTINSPSVAAGAWHHVLISLHDPTLRMWVDGVRSDATDTRTGTPISFASIRLGGAMASAYSGSLDEVWVAQTAVPTDEAALSRFCPVQ